MEKSLEASPLVIQYNCLILILLVRNSHVCKARTTTSILSVCRTWEMQAGNAMTRVFLASLEWGSVVLGQEQRQV